MGTLYLVATPIGNLEDISMRALRVLRAASLIAAEDTRQTAKLLRRYDIHTPTTSYFEHNKLAKLDVILQALAGGDVALVSDGGVPGLSDPGYELVRAAIEAGYHVSPIPGPSAVLAALAASGLPTDAFVYLGFLPRRAAERRARLAALAGERRTLVVFEAPHRLRAALADILRELGDRRVAVCRELTKLHEEIFRGPASEALARWAEEPPRGEITLVIEGAPESAGVWDEARVKAALAKLIAAGESPRSAAKEVARLSGRPSREVYRLWTR